LWGKGGAGRTVGSVFPSRAVPAAGQDTTITSFHITLLHHGMVIAGVPFSVAELSNIDEVSGGSPYGASTIAGSDGSRTPSQNELAIARAQGAHVAGLAATLAV